jgi:hypothetical protein
VEKVGGKLNVPASPRKQAGDLSLNALKAQGRHGGK